MSENLEPPPVPIGLGGRSDEDHGPLRSFSRSPHPYHRLNSELLDPSDRISFRPRPGSPRDGDASFSPLTRDSSHPSDSGTEADDEHFLKGLPAPKSRLHKGLRGANEQLSGASTPVLSPAVLEEEGRKAAAGGVGHAGQEREKRRALDRVRRRKELVRRAAEVVLLACQVGMVASNAEVQPFLLRYHKAATYPLRLVVWAYRQGKPSKTVPLRIPASLDPAPLLYPPLVPVLVSLLVAPNVKHGVVPSLVLTLSALPRPLIPGARHWEPISSTHWVLSCIPFSLPLFTSAAQPVGQDGLSREVLVLLYPLHQTLCPILHHLTTTSLLVSEVQLLSVALISLFLLASSPQAVILKALLWGGGIGLLALCSHVIQWSISLSRVPKWRFRRSPPSARPESAYQVLRQFLPRSRPRSWSKTSHATTTASDTDQSVDEYLDGLAERTTPSGRPKRAVSTSVRAFFSLTEAQATLRKWLYAGWAYLCILLIILVGIRLYVQQNALSGNEPIGWALGYLFGDLPAFRFHVVQASLERWICLPPLLGASSSAPTTDGPCREGCTEGWVQHLRLTSFGASNTRLFISLYWLLVLVTGLAIVFRLSQTCEVDTRRKVFHFMMVAMFLPATYVDPCYAALALALVLAIFLLLDMLRASQLPPLSRPIARFLAPLASLPRSSSSLSSSSSSSSSASSSPDSEPTPPFQGWDTPTREVAMLAGVICVGLGDAAASLVGRRWGRHKWLWSGGKSLEGSVAFAGAVFAGLVLAAGWLRVGGWEVTTTAATVNASTPATGSGMEALRSLFDLGWWRGEVPRAAGCATLASMTEAVLTGGNDNVVVPVVLWGCVKSLGV
ncbi:hypothetical protein VTJ49DRAFT_7122 [Mycothermus thermophilus]|uniref:dolichol kinase n=1 Tax=Humicola insolens TaxID=85995 RepID=A0ABR3VHZ2_HUMIN